MSPLLPQRTWHGAVSETPATSGKRLLSRTPELPSVLRVPAVTLKRGWVFFGANPPRQSRAVLTLPGTHSRCQHLSQHPHSAIYFFPQFICKRFTSSLQMRAGKLAALSGFATGRVEISGFLLQIQQLSPACPCLLTAAGDVAVRGRGCPVPPAPRGDAAHRPRLSALGARCQRAGAAHQPLRGRVRCSPCALNPSPPCYSPKIF